METVISGPLLTPAEHRTYLDELDRLREIRDRDLPELLRTARTFVADDAAEEIIQIRDDRAVVDARIARLEQLLETARIVDGEATPESVTLGRSAEVEYLGTGKVVTYRVVGIPGGSASGTVSASSPVGAALIGRSAGEIVPVDLPGGRSERLKILSVVDAAATWA
jgi:transcription elongation factor GreA